MNNKKILLAEDDINLGKLLRDYLNAKGFETSLVTNGEEAFKQFHKDHYNLCLFDVMMPIQDGFSLAKSIRKINTEVPIIFLTAKSMKEDTLEGFKSGGDDYIKKPFSMEELLARIQAVLKRTEKQNPGVEVEEVKIGKYTYNYKNRKLIFKDIPTKLTSKENELLNLLTRNIEQVVERGYALNLVWGDDSHYNARSMDVYIAKLRKHLKEDSRIEIINIHGKGFRLVVNQT